MSYFPEDVVSDALHGMPVTYWCNGCNAEPAKTTVEVMFNGHWVPVQLGENCLTRAEEAGRIEE